MNNTPSRNHLEIEDALHQRQTTYKLHGEPISREQAMMILGRRKFITGIIRSVSHTTAKMEADDGSIVYFDSSELHRG